MPLTLTPQTMPEITVDFRAPPPSPVASGRRSTFTNEDVLTEFLEASLRVPDLVLPDKIFPKQKLLETPPKVDFVSLCFHHDEELYDVVSDSMATFGCFQLLNHGISPKLISSVASAATGIFTLPMGMRAPAIRSPEKPWGFEEYHEGEEEEEEQGNEEFVWCKDAEFNSKMEGILPNEYPNFSKKMERLKSQIDRVAEKILEVILKDICRKFVSNEVGMLCCVFKHRKDNMSDRFDNTLKYEVIRMLIRGGDYSHSLCLHVCDGSSEFHVYSKKSWLSFCPEQGAIIITGGDQIQVGFHST